MFGLFPMTSQGSTMFEMTPIGAVITFIRLYVIGYLVTTY